MEQKVNGKWAVIGDKRFFRKLTVIALPVALQGFLNTAINMADTVMVGSLGETSLAAVGLANKVFFVFTLLIFGIVSGSGILAAQYWGNKDIMNIRKVLGLALILGLSGSLLFVIPSLVCPGLLMRIFTTSDSTIKLGAMYLIIVCISYPFTAVTNIYVAMLRAVGRARIPVFISCVTLLVNMTCNYILIYGKFGAPALGVAGAAYATLISRVIETVIILCIVYLGKTEIAARISEMLGYSKIFIKQYITTVTPVIANEFIWGLGVTMYSLAYGRMGDEAVSAITIASTIQDLASVLFQGISTAAAVVLGNEMGAGCLDLAEKYAKKFILLQLILSVISAIACVAFRWSFISIYNISDTVANHVSTCLIISACYMPFKMFNYVNIVGILRSGGDTKACLILDCIGVWLIGIPMAFGGGLVLKLPITIVYAMVMTEEIFKFILGYKRYRSKKWLRNLTSELT